MSNTRRALLCSVALGASLVMAPVTQTSAPLAALGIGATTAQAEACQWVRDAAGRLFRWCAHRQLHPRAGAGGMLGFGLVGKATDAMLGTHRRAVPHEWYPYRNPAEAWYYGHRRQQLGPSHGPLHMKPYGH
jgi:hypothetical protein